MFFHTSYGMIIRHVILHLSLGVSPGTSTPRLFLPAQNEFKLFSQSSIQALTQSEAAATSVCLVGTDSTCILFFSHSVKASPGSQMSHSSHTPHGHKSGKQYHSLMTHRADITAIHIHIK